ncbi:MAG TPA: LLM class flavin-dependent oxidoreductase [Herpetosiphonaceae bacterium]|nr:LLM class flavin-dependent oxidoreductase [Herpetosiphonaceae bacterium]
MTQDDRQPGNTTARTLRDRVGLSIWAANPPSLVQLIEEAELAGVEQIWMTQGPVSHDTLTTYAVALARTSRIRLGTSIVPTYPRHPLALAQQAATAASFGSDRLRLGVGPSHRPSIEGAYGIRMEAPLEHLREYVHVLRAALWDGTVEHQGRFITAKATSSSTTQIPLLVSALGEGAFRLAGEISDGAISWNCPPSYLLDVALPALRDGARAARRAVPPLVAHVWVALSTDRVAVRHAARKRLATYARLPFYANMFAASGFPVQADGTLSDELIDNLVAMGDESTVTARLNELLAGGLDELLVSLMPLEDEVSELTRTFDLIGRL